MATAGEPLVFVSVGTDHHPFDRLVQWVDAWVAGGGRARCIVQYGTSKPPATCEGHDYLPYARMNELMAEASALVCHGGPATIMGGREHRLLPIVVPREQRLGEHVDDHQVRFTRWMAEREHIVVATDAEALGRLLDRLTERRDAFRIPASQADATDLAVARFGDAVDALVDRDR
jgi:UDP-N-acetylglucosamine transferase subunit ALG13